MEGNSLLRLNKMSEKTCLVTGGAGFIGCGLSSVLAERFSRYVVMDNLHPQVHQLRERPMALHRGAEMTIGDVTEPGDWDVVLRDFRPEVVIHLAGETGTGQSLSEATRHALVNVVGTTQMIDAFGRHGHIPEQIVLASSRAVYGEGAWRNSDGTVFYPGQRSNAQLSAGQWDFPQSVALPNRAVTVNPDPTSVYGASKLAQEHIIRAWALSWGVSCNIVRLQNVFGPGQSLTNTYTGVVTLFSRLAKARQQIPIYEDGNITRDFVFIDDVVDAMARAVALPPGTFRVLDIGSGQSITLKSLADQLVEMYGAPPAQICGKFRNGDVRHASCDIDDTVRELDWQPRWAFADGLVALRGWIEDKL